MEIIALQYNIYAILGVVIVFVAGLVWGWVMGNRLGWILVIGAAIYAWFQIIQPLISSR